MARIVFIGAGSFGFTRKLVRDIFTFENLRDATIVLMDIDTERLDYIHRAARRIIEAGGYPARIEVTKDRKEALKGADAVVCTIQGAGVDVWRQDVEIPLEYGVDFTVGDTRGPSGIFRALRTIPIMLDICRDIERYCPGAILLNYTNPMSMLCRAMQIKSDVRAIGLCHSVQGTAKKLAGWIGVEMERVTYLCAGINHQSWYIEYKVDGRDAYPLIRKALRLKKNRDSEIVRNEMFRHLGYYVTESSYHNSEYNWWFRKRPELVREYCEDNLDKYMGPSGGLVRIYLDREHSWRGDIEKWLAEPLNLERGHEYAASIINACLGGEPFEFNGNVPNTGLVTNLPPDTCVEVPVLANRRGFNPIHVGALPPQCAALNNICIASEEMAVEAALTGDTKRLMHAIAYDPLTAAVCSLEEIRKMVNQMLEANRGCLPQFRKFRV